MREVILGPNPKTIELNSLTGREIVCYLSSKTNTPKLLTRVKEGRNPHAEKWAFISLAYPNSEMVFAGETWYDAAKKALQGGRQLFTFDSYDEFRQWALTQPITRS